MPYALNPKPQPPGPVGQQGGDEKYYTTPAHLITKGAAGFPAAPLPVQKPYTPKP
jgi:hypothetical protein